MAVFLGLTRCVNLGSRGLQKVDSPRATIPPVSYRLSGHDGRRLVIHPHYGRIIRATLGRVVQTN